MRILITGFGPFPGVPENPTALLIKQLQKKGCAIPEVKLTTAVLPVSYAACLKWATTAFSPAEFDAVLHLGVAANAAEFRLETVARNRCSVERPDAFGEHWPDACILPGEPDELRSACQVLRLSEMLRAANIPATVSDDAGDYLCNLLYYLSLRRARSLGLAIPVMFLHVPHSRETHPGPQRGNSAPVSVQHRPALNILISELLKSMLDRRSLECRGCHGAASVTERLS